MKNKTCLIISAIIIGILFIITIISIITYLKLNKNKIQSISHYSHEMESTILNYNKSATQIFKKLIEMKVEWWPTEGTLIGMLRWGSNFGKIDDGIIATDTDIDIMIRVKDEQDWERIKKEIKSSMLHKNSIWTNCQDHNHDICISRKNPKLTCHTNYNFGPSCWDSDSIHFDLHSYMVDEEQNIIYMDPICKDNPPLCKDKYPFQKWGGVAPYRGLIVNEQGKFTRVKFNELSLPCPYKPIEILSLWNNNEYGDGTTLHLPEHNCIFNNKWVKGKYNISINDISRLQQINSELHQNHYQSFYNKNNKNNKNINTTQKPLTIVTAYFDLEGKSKKGISGSAKYKSWMISLLSYYGPMVIFIDSKTKFYAEILRKGLPTLFIDKELDQLMCNKYKGMFNLDKAGWAETGKNTNEEAMAIIWNEKLEFIKQAIHLSNFKTPYYAWYDAGYIRTAKRLPKNWPDEVKLYNCGDKVQLLTFSSKETVCSKPYHPGGEITYDNPPHGVMLTGGFILGKTNALLQFHKLYYDILEEQVQKREYAGNDQYNFSKCYCRYPSLFNLISSEEHDFVDNDKWFYGIPYFFSKNHIKNLIIVAHEDDESIWANQVLGLSTKVIWMTKSNKFNAGLNAMKLSETEYTNIGFEATPWEKAEFPGLRADIEKWIQKLVTILKASPHIENIYTHNTKGEYGHIDHISTRHAVLSAHFLTKHKAKIFEFDPDFSKKCDEDVFRKILLDTYNQEDVGAFRKQCHEIKEKSTSIRFLHIFYINLAKRVDRKKQVEAEFINIPNISLQRFEAIEKPNHGALGCSLSHIEVLKLAIQKNLPYVLIIEDDFEFTMIPQIAMDRLYEALDYLNNDWDVLLLTASVYNKKTEKITSINPIFGSQSNILNLSKVVKAQTTGAYLVNKHYYQTLLDNFIEGAQKLEKNISQKDKFSLFEIDQYWEKLQRKDNWFIMEPIIAKQRDSYSDIIKENVSYEFYQPKIITTSDRKNNYLGTGEPSNIDDFWEENEDRYFMTKLYPLLSTFSTVLDIGARLYNQRCKSLINSSKTKYYQLEPYPPEKMDNDGLLHCAVQESMKLYPQYAKFFEIIIDFGVFGWVGTHFTFNDKIEYIDNILFLLKDNGIWILKIDINTDSNNQEHLITSKDFDELIDPFFTHINFTVFQDGQNFGKDCKIYFLQKKVIDNKQMKIITKDDINKLLTIGIKTFFRPHCLENSIKRIRMFYPHILILVCDDSDEEVKKLNQLVIDKYENVKYIELPFDSGLSKGRNTLVNSCYTKYFMITDDDLYIKNDGTLELMVTCLEHVNIDLIGANCENGDNNGIWHRNFKEISKISNPVSIIGHKYNIKYTETKNYINNPFVKKLLNSSTCLNFFITETNKLKISPWRNSLKVGEHEIFFVDWYLNNFTVGIAEDINFLELEGDDKKYLKDLKKFRSRASKGGIFDPRNHVNFIEYYGSSGDKKCTKLSLYVGLIILFLIILIAGFIICRKLIKNKQK